MNRFKNYHFISLLIIIYGLSVIIPVQGQGSEIEVTLTWSTNTYVPLDYPGKSLPTRESVIEVVANIDSQETNPQTLTFNWFLDNKIQKNNSGLGKDVFSFKLSTNINKEYGVRVEIGDKTDNLITLSHVYIKLVEPEISLGIPPEYQAPDNQEIEFTAQPYFFNINDINELNYDWSLNGQSASQVDNDDPNTIILKIGEINQPTYQTLTVWAENESKLLQKAKDEARITFIP